MAQGRLWKVTLRKGADALVLALQRDGLPEELPELRDLRFEAPLARWNGLVKYVASDRKLLGGLLLDFASQKDLVAAVIANDRLFAELQRVVIDATVALVEAEVLLLQPLATEEI